MDGAAGSAADPPHNYQANDLSVSNYVRHCVCEAILYKMLVYDRDHRQGEAHPSQLHVQNRG